MAVADDGVRRATAAKAHALIEALPWLQRLHGSTIVIRAGGSTMTDETLKRAFAQDVAFLRCAGLGPVVVHGDESEVKTHLTGLGRDSGLTAEPMDLVRMVITGRAQRELVGLLNRHGPFAIGLTGEDAHTITAGARRATADGEPLGPGAVHDVGEVNADVVRALLDNGRIPVVSSIARSTNGDICRVSPDAAAAALAAALRAERLVLLSDTEGLPTNRPHGRSVIGLLTTGELEHLLPELGNTWRPPMEACLRALRSGVGRARVLDGRVPHVLLHEVFAGEALGTTVRPGTTGSDPRGPGTEQHPGAPLSHSGLHPDQG
ncbi:acetylglutamate kinase [Streptomyces sp. BRA346]|uniref:acetylglutamate kinase n=1 Tax=Streptomyces sp. BRA346 TaxID=2878199 RepID=UPI0040641223